MAELARKAARNKSHSFSPLHEGDTSVAQQITAFEIVRHIEFQSPSRGGHLRGDVNHSKAKANRLLFQSPSRGGHLRGQMRVDVSM